MSDDTELGPSGSELGARSLSTFDDDFNTDEEICRVCRVSGEGTLYHPCLCAGSIKYVHQECLLQWLKYSKKEVCELCNHKFSFQPVYAENMPQHLPVSDVVKGVFLLLAKFLKFCVRMAFVAFCWLILVPMIASRTHQLVFNGLISSIFSKKILLFFSIENISIDIMRGWIIMTLFVCTFIALVWLREQVNVGNGAQDVNIVAARPLIFQNQEQDLPDVARIFPADDEPLNPVVNNVEAEEMLQEGLPVEPAIENRRDVEQFVENMTWQRLLGLDGSFVFIENVFWVISLNFVFHVALMLFPSMIGSKFLHWIGLSDHITYFKTAINVFVGYGIINLVVYFLHWLCKKLEYQAMAAFTQVTYLIIKVMLLVVTELVIFPIICGWWLDLCSLLLTGSQLNNKIKTFHTYPISSTVLHWLAGMLYVFYSASFILALRALLRPGVLWFIRNLNDPDFSPINEMIDQPFQKHCRRLVASTTLFLSIIFLVVYCPIRIIKACTQNTVLPYVLNSTDGQFGGFSLELMLLQVVLPTTLEYMKAYLVLDYLVKSWCRVVGRLLKMDNYLLSRRDLNGSVENKNEERQQNGAQNENPIGPENVQQQPNDLAGRHHALLVARENQEIEAYARPNNFKLRLVALLFCLAATIVLLSLTLLVVPVTVGRLLLICIGVGSHAVQDIYSVSIGFYACWLMGKLCLVTMDWFKRGREYVNVAFKRGFYLCVQIMIAIVPVLGVIPILLSLYFQLLIISPLRVSISQTPLFFMFKEWGMGILHLKIICATILMGPDFWLKTALEQVYVDGFRGLRLRALYIDVIFPVVNTLTLLIVGPYVVVRSVLLCLDLTPEENATIVRFSFPCLLIGIIGVMYLKWLYGKLCSLHKRLRDEKYLIGSQLVNLYREGTASSS